MSYVEEIDRLTEQLAQVTAHRDGLAFDVAHEQVRRETAEAQRDRALAERDTARENARTRTRIAHDLDTCNQMIIRNLTAERNRARDLAQHLEEEAALTGKRTLDLDAILACEHGCLYKGLVPECEIHQ